MSKKAKVEAPLSQPVLTAQTAQTPEAVLVEQGALLEDPKAGIQPPTDTVDHTASSDANGASDTSSPQATPEPVPASEYVPENLVTPPSEDAPIALPLPQPGEILKAYRESAQVDAQRLASTLKVPVKKIEALEASDWSAFPDMVFTRSLVGSVCRYLKADPVPVLALIPGGLRTASVSASSLVGKNSTHVNAKQGPSSASVAKEPPQSNTLTATRTAGAADPGAGLPQVLSSSSKPAVLSASPTQKIIQQTANSTSMGDEGDVPLRKRLLSPAVLLPAGLVAAAALVFFEPWASFQSAESTAVIPQGPKTEVVVPTPQPALVGVPAATSGSGPAEVVQPASSLPGAAPVAPAVSSAQTPTAAAVPVNPVAAFNGAADAPEAPSKALLVVQASAPVKLEVLTPGGEKLTSRSLQAGETVSVNREGGAVVVLEPASGVLAWSQGKALKLSPKAGEGQLRFELPLKP